MPQKPILSNEDELISLSDQRLDMAWRYDTERKAYGKAKAVLDILYASKIKLINDLKKNAGYETGLLILVSTNKLYNKMYEDMITHLHNYKGLERIIDAMAAKQSCLQSIMKNNRLNDN